MNRSDIQSRLLGIVAECADVGADEVATSDHLYERVGMDSLGAVAMVVEIQRAFGLAIPEAEIPRLVTVDLITDFILDHE